MSTALSVREVRAQLLHEALLCCPNIERLDDLLEHLPQFARWNPEILGHAVDDCINAGLLTEAADGRLCIHRRPAR